MQDSLFTRAGTCLLFAAALCLSTQAQSLLVVNQGNATVSIVDPKQDAQIAAVQENVSGVHGHEIVATADGRTAFLPIYGSVGVGKPGIDGHEMLVLDLPSRKVVAHVDFGHGVRPHDPVLDRARNLLYVTTELDRSVAILDPHSYKIVGSIPTGQDQSHMLVLSHDGKRGYTANVGPGSVSVLDMNGRKTVAVIPVSGKVQRIAISNDDRYVFTSDQTSPRLAVIDTANNKIVKWVALPGTGYGAAATQDGKSLLVAIPPADEVAVVDMGSMKVTRRIAVPSSPQEVLIRPDGRFAYVSCNASGKVAVIDLASWAVTGNIAAGPFADGLAWAR